jgi:hypothetical protein
VTLLINDHAELGALMTAFHQVLFGKYCRTKSNTCAHPIGAGSTNWAHTPLQKNICQCIVLTLALKNGRHDCCKRVSHSLLRTGQSYSNLQSVKSFSVANRSVIF